jgi:hypothetical protein
MIKQLLSVLLYISIVTVSLAQVPSGKKIYTLKECVEIALQNNLTVKRSALGLKGADITLDQFVGLRWFEFWTLCGSYD